MLSYVRGEYFALAFRRGITHGWPALVVLTFVVAGFILAWDQWVRLRRDPDAEPARAGPILALSAVGLLTHPTLDWMNTYGMRWWLPFDGSWSYGDALFIVDPWIWLALGGAVFLSSTQGRRGLAVWGALAVGTSVLVVLAGGPRIALGWGLGLGTIVLLRRRSAFAEDAAQALVFPRALPHRAVAATVGCVAIYVLVLVTSDRTARGLVRETAEAAGLTVTEVMLAPRPGNPFRSDVEVLTPEVLVPGSYSWLGSPSVELDPGAAVPVLGAPANLGASRLEEILAAARAEPTARDYLVWSRYPYVRIAQEGDGWRVRFSDARYDGRPEAAGLAGLSVWVPNPENR